MNVTRLARSIPLLLISFSIQAEEITLDYQGMQLNAQYEHSPDNSKTILITHGTLAHNKMELISTLQELLTDEGYNTLAINLALGVNNRHGMYDCTTPHQHRHQDASAEINAWLNWLKESQQTKEVILMGHSRGGNQTAWFQQDFPEHSLVKAQVLIAPATWQAETEAEGYQKRYGKPLNELLSLAKAHPEEWLEGVGFIYCENSKVKGADFLSYYQPDPRFNTPYLLNNSNIPTLVIAGSEDKTVSDLPEQMETVNNDRVRFEVIEGADHFFRDLYADEVLELTSEFIETL